MLRADWDTVRLMLHVTGAAIWLGGQLTLIHLLSTVRRMGEDAPRVVARRFNSLAWSGYGILLATGIWALLVLDVGDRTTQYQVTLLVKLTVVAVSGAGAAVHAFAQNKIVLAVSGTFGFLGAVGAVFLGVLLRG